MPIFIEMGRQIVHGSFPFMTLKSWNAGAIAAEYQYGVFNPVNLMFSAIFYMFIDKFSHAAALFSIFHLIVFGLGVFAICGSLRCRMPEAAFAAVVAGTGIWLIYFAAMSWVENLASIAWFAWTIAALLRLEQEPRWLIPSALLIALTIVSGTPHTDVALLVFVAIYLLRILVGAGWRACLIPLLAAIAGGLMAAPSLLPLIVFHVFSIRQASFPKLQWTVPIYAFFSLGLPIFAAPWYTWIYEPGFDWLKWGVYGFPIVYLDWVVPIILVKAWRDERQVFSPDNS
jgi:hypothetical protein